MKKNKIYLIMFCFLLGVSCSEDNKIGEIESLTPDYVLPQGKSPADDRIVELYGQYGTYILYEYTKPDFQYGLGLNTCEFTLPNPLYVGDMLDFLDDIWFQFYPTVFHKQYMPYKLFLAEKLESFQWDGSLVTLFLYAGEYSLAFGFCSNILHEMSSNMKLEFKNQLQKQLWTSWLENSLLELPSEFYEISDYTKEADGYDVSSPNYARVRGFVSDNGEEWCTYLDWQTNMLDKQRDIKTFILGMVSRSSEDWTSDLLYPLIKQKYDILRNHFLNKYNFDIQKIGDSVY